MRINLLLFIILNASVANGQRAPVRYVPIDSITIISSNEDVKLDFKGKTIINGRVPTAYPWLKNAKPQQGMGWIGDTIYLPINKERIQFIERKGFGVDYYYFPAERLESNTYRKDHSLIIPMSIVKEVRADSILFRMTVILNKRKRNGKWKQVYSREQDLWIERKMLDGVLITEKL